MSREFLGELLNIQQQIAEEKRRRLQLCTEIVLNIFVELGGRWTIDDLKIRLRTRGGDPMEDQELKVILDNLVGAGFIQCTDNGTFFA